MEILIWIAVGMFAAFLLVHLIQRNCGFRAQTPDDYASYGPGFDIRERFCGPMHCEGVIYGPLGRVTSRFIAEFHADWNGNTGTMKEVFHYDSGQIQNREWTLCVDNNGRISATAPDVLGAGTGQQSGASVVLNYTIRLTKDAGGHALNVTDWMYLMENGVIMNRSQFRKFGVKVAELVATMRPAETERKALIS